MTRNAFLVRHKATGLFMPSLNRVPEVEKWKPFPANIKLFTSYAAAERSRLFLVPCADFEVVTAALTFEELT